MDEGWQELGQILLALRAHDQRIEDELEDLLYLYIPKPPEVQRTFIAVVSVEGKRIQYWQHHGPPGQAQEAVERVLDGKSKPAEEFDPITPDALPENEITPITDKIKEALQYDESGEQLGLMGETKQTTYSPIEPSQIITGKKNEDGSVELRRGNSCPY